MYNVALVYTREAGGYEGNITWTTFESKEEFDSWYSDDIKKGKRVVEEGVSQERCVELVRQTPRACRMAAAVEASQDPETGRIHPEILRMELVKMMSV